MLMMHWKELYISPKNGMKTRGQMYCELETFDNVMFILVWLAMWFGEREIAFHCLRKNMKWKQNFHNSNFRWDNSNPMLLRKRFSPLVSILVLLLGPLAKGQVQQTRLGISKLDEMNYTIGGVSHPKILVRLKII